MRWRMHSEDAKHRTWRCLSCRRWAVTQLSIDDPGRCVCAREHSSAGGALKVAT